MLQVPRAECSCPFPPPQSLFGFGSFPISSVLVRVLPHLSPCSGSFPTSSVSVRVLSRLLSPFPILPHTSLVLVRVLPYLLSPCSGPSSVLVRVLPQSLFGSFLSPCSGPSSVPVQVLPQSLFGSFLSPCSGPFPPPQSLFGSFPTYSVPIRVLSPASSVPFRSFPPPN